MPGTVPGEGVIPARDIAAAKLNLALHVRGRRGDGRHDIETIFVFCSDGDRLSAIESDGLSLEVKGPFGACVEADETNLVMRAARALRDQSGITKGASITLDKRLPVASGVGGGSADAAAALRLLSALWNVDPNLSIALAPQLGSDVPACLLSMPMRGTGAGDVLEPVDLELSGVPVLLINPRVEIPTRQVFEQWDGQDRGPLTDWQDGRNDLERPAAAMVPQIETVLAWLAVQPGVTFRRMSGSGATCFAFFEDEAARDSACDRVPREWWRLATSLR